MKEMSASEAYFPYVVGNVYLCGQVGRFKRMIARRMWNVDGRDGKGREEREESRAEQRRDYLRHANRARVEFRNALVRLFAPFPDPIVLCTDAQREMQTEMLADRCATEALRITHRNTMTCVYLECRMLMMYL